MMARVGGKDTGPELTVRSAAHRLGYRFRLHCRDLPGTPDLVFRGRRGVVFVHGCFWHSHPGCKRATRPSSNIDFWRNKLDRNVERDRTSVALLEGEGWDVLVIWECETKDAAELERRLVEFLG